MEEEEEEPLSLLQSAGGGRMMEQPSPNFDEGSEQYLPPKF